MAIFAVLMPTAQPVLAEAIRTRFPTDHLAITDTQWLVSFAGTAVELTARLGIYDAKAPGNVATGSAVIFGVSSYYGRAPQTTWEWIKTKMETPGGV